jgi:hypothetical protein
MFVLAEGAVIAVAAIVISCVAVALSIYAQLNMRRSMRVRKAITASRREADPRRAIEILDSVAPRRERRASAGR